MVGTTPVLSDDQGINWDLLTELAGKPHKHLNLSAECSWYTCEHGHEHTGTDEVLQEARTVQHLCDIANVPEGRGYSAHIDARVFQLLTMKLDFQERAARISDIHVRETGPAGTVGDYCTECAHRWPCPTRRLADGTPLEDDE